MEPKAKDIGIQVAAVLKEIDYQDKKELLKGLVNNLDKESKLLLENVMEVII